MAATITQEPVQHQLEMLQYENEQLKEDSRALREEMERWKETRRKQPTRGPYTLAKAAIQFDDSLSRQEK